MNIILCSLLREILLAFVLVSHMPSNITINYDQVLNLFILISALQYDI